MIAFGLGLLVGVAGAGAAAILVARQRRPRRGESVIDIEMDAETLDEVDRRHLAAEFANHVEALRIQVGEYADALAGDDEVLRARLRAFEAGER